MKWGWVLLNVPGSFYPVGIGRLGVLKKRHSTFHVTMHIVMTIHMLDLLQLFFYIRKDNQRL